MPEAMLERQPATSRLDTSDSAILAPQPSATAENYRETPIVLNGGVEIAFKMNQGPLNANRGQSAPDDPGKCVIAPATGLGRRSAD
jgi:hypothetical protein